MISKIIFLNVYHQSRLQVYWEHSIPLELDRVPYWRYRVKKLPLLRLRKLICQRCQCVLEIWIGKIQCKHRNLILLNSKIAKHSLKATKMVWCINHFSLVILSSANSFGRLFLLLLFSKKKKNLRTRVTNLAKYAIPLYISKAPQPCLVAVLKK